MKVFDSIRNKLIIFTLCISLIPVSVITIVYYFSAKSALKKLILNELAAVAESKEIHILSFVEALRGRTIDFSSDGFIRDSLERIARRGYQSNEVLNLNRHLRVNKMPIDPHILGIAIAGRDGTVVSSTNEKIIGGDVSEHELFVNSIGSKYGETYIGGVYHTPWFDEDCIFVSTPLISKLYSEDETIGIIINAYALSSLDDIVGRYTGMGETGEVIIGHEKGGDIAYLNSLRYPSNTLTDSAFDTSNPAFEPMKLAVSGKKGIITAPDYRNIKVLAVYNYLPETGWGLVAKIDRAEAFAPLQRLGIIAMVGGGVCCVAIIVLGTVLSVSTTKPITKLKYAAERFGKGDLDYRLDITGRDEIGVLGSSFNAMAQEIKTLTDSLEKRLNERTYNLTRTNEKLQKEILWRRQMEAELRKLSRAVEQSPVSIVITDRKGAIEYVNPKFTLLTGYDYEEVAGQNPRILKSDNQSPEIYKELWGKISSGKEWHGELCNKKKDGSPFWITLSISSVKNTDGIITHFVGVQEDITVRKQFEEKLKYLNETLEKRVAVRTEKLKESNEQLRNEIIEHRRVEEELLATNKELEAFCYSVSHDLRSPLRSINGFSKVLFEDYKNTLDSRGKDYLQRVWAASQRMGHLIDDLLNLSRITRSEMKKKRLDLSAIAKRKVSKLKRIKSDRSVDFSVRDGIYVNGDEGLLRIAIDNLLDNAWKYTKKNDRAKIEFGAMNHSGKSVYFVKDDGVGFDMEYAHKLFGAFQRLHAPSEFEGTGIGLATVQRVIHRHGGRIWAEGAVGHGATFFFTLPQAD